MRNTLRTLVAVAVLAVGVAGCDFGEQNIEWEPGDSLLVFGPVDESGGAVGDDITEAGLPVLYAPATAYFFVNGFTLEKEYTWTLNGTPVDGLETAEVLNQGEFLRVTFTDPGTYTIGVDDGRHAGTQEVVITEPPVGE